MMPTEIHRAVLSGVAIGCAVALVLYLVTYNMH
jgi:hypothetical protein